MIIQIGDQLELVCAAAVTPGPGSLRICGPMATPAWLPWARGCRDSGLRAVRAACVVPTWAEPGLPAGRLGWVAGAAGERGLGRGSVRGRAGFRLQVRDDRLHPAGIHRADLILQHFAHDHMRRRVIS
jgi:hypothetical protein